MAASTGHSVGWVFLDRDGTLNTKPPAGEYVEQPEQLQLLPGAAEAVAKLNRAGIWTAVVTNQRGVALGRMTVEDLDAVHQRLAMLLAREDAHLDAVYSCPHGLGECDCRKPHPGMLLTAKRDHPEIDLARAAIVGDSPSDIETGRRLGLRTIMIGASSDAAQPDQLAGSLLEAVSLLLDGEQASPRLDG